MAGADHARGVDFERDVHCIAGLPFDALDMACAVARVRRAAFTGTRCVIATPNLNFVFAARGDAAFRDSVCGSDMVLADGMPIIWMARLLGVPITERLSGASLFEAMCAADEPPVTVYFYGGPKGAAAAAREALDRRGGGLRCVGHESPPFAPLDALSGAETIERINASGAQFVIVSLGAVKGQAWIELNRSRLAAPVLCHLGAVVNFAAGTVQRAPVFWQRAGLEWLWRTKEEPALWRRYRDDGLRFLGLLSREVVPAALLLRRVGGPGAKSQRAEIAREEGTEHLTLGLRGAWSQRTIGPLRVALREAAADHRTVTLLLREVAFGDSAFVALLVLARAAMTGRLHIVEPSAAAAAALRGCGATYLLSGPLKASADGER